MSATTTTLRGDAGTDSRLGAPTGWWAMLLLVFTEAALFASLLLAYFYERSNAPEWPPAGVEEPKLFLPLIMTAALLLSSGTMLWAERGIRNGNQGALRIGLMLSLLLALAFLAMQAREYSDKSFALDDSVYSSAFFTITGMHGLHVTAAIVVGLVVTVRAFLGHFSERHHDAIRIVSLYWHFVDVVWLFILASLYISPHLL